MNLLRSIVFVLAVVLTGASSLGAETGAEGWLRYAPVAREAGTRDNAIPNVVVYLGDSEVLNSAKDELIRGVESMFGKRLQSEQNVSAENAFVLGTFKDIREKFHEVQPSSPLSPDGFWLRTL